MSLALLREERPVARKLHGCGACLGYIGAGDRYYSQTVADNGELWQWKAHHLCVAIADQLRREAGWWEDDEGPDPSEVREYLRQVLGAVFT